MKAKLIKENLNESMSHEFSPKELFVVLRSGDSMSGSAHNLDTIYTDEGDARPEAMYRNSEGYRTGSVTRSSEWKVFTVQDLIDMID